MDLILIDKKLKSGEITPFELDLSEIQKKSGLVPNSGVFDLNIAEELATQFIKAADMCIDLHAIAIKHEGRMLALQKKAWAEAMYIRASEKGIKTVKDREAFADSDNEYILATEKAVDATAFRKWIESKHDMFVRSHHLCKKLYEKSKEHEPWASRVINNSVDEKDLDFGEEKW